MLSSLAVMTREETLSSDQLRRELAKSRLRIAALEARNGGGMEAALLEKEAELRAIAEALPDLVIRVRRDGTLLHLSSPSQDVLSRPAEELVGRNIRHTGLPAETLAVHLECVRAAFETQTVQTFDYALRVAKGHRDFEGRAVACSRDEALLIIRDVTEAKQALVGKRKLEGDLHQARRMESIGRLAGGLAHNLNNLLAPIFGYTELMLENSISAERRQDYLSTVLQAAEGARDLTRQLLAISHQQAPEIRRIDLRKIVSGFEKILRRAIREDIEIELQQAEDPVIIAADVSQVEQILLNLAINAQDAMPSSGRMTIETRPVLVNGEDPRLESGRYGALRVSDTGSGIDEEIREQIFEPFFTTKEPGKGTGLGLATVHAIVRQHGGDLRLESVVDGGSSFEIILPYGEDSLSAAFDSAAPRLDEIRGGTETVLVAEDNGMVQQLVGRILRRHGYTVIVSDSSEHCLQLVRECRDPIDLLLTDVVMPRLNGPELHQQLRRLSPRLKVLYMSGYADEVIADHGIERGGAPIIQKPFSIQGLLVKVREALIYQEAIPSQEPSQRGAIRGV